MKATHTQLSFNEFTVNDSLKNEPILNIEQLMEFKYELKPKTNNRYGILINWKFVFGTTKGYILKGSTAQSFRHDSLSSFSFHEMQELINESFTIFKTNLIVKTQKEGIFVNLNYKAMEKETIAMMYHLNPSRVNFVVAKDFIITPAHSKVISTIGQFLNVILKELLPEIIKSNTFLEYGADKDNIEGFALEVLTEDDLVRKRVKSRIEISLNNWKGLN